MDELYFVALKVLCASVLDIVACCILQQATVLNTVEFNKLAAPVGTLVYTHIYLNNSE